MPALKYATHASLFSKRLISPFTVSACWCGPNRPPFSQKSPTGTCQVDTGNGCVSSVMSTMYALVRMPLAHGFMSAAPAASSVMNA